MLLWASFCSVSVFGGTFLMLLGSYRLSLVSPYTIRCFLIVSELCRNLCCRWLLWVLFAAQNFCLIPVVSLFPLRFCDLSNFKEALWTPSLLRTLVMNSTTLLETPLNIYCERFSLHFCCCWCWSPVRVCDLCNFHKADTPSEPLRDTKVMYVQHLAAPSRRQLHLVSLTTSLYCLPGHRLKVAHVLTRPSHFVHYNVALPFVTSRGYTKHDLTLTTYLAYFNVFKDGINDTRSVKFLLQHYLKKNTDWKFRITQNSSRFTPVLRTVVWSTSPDKKACLYLVYIEWLDENLNNLCRELQFYTQLTATNAQCLLPSFWDAEGGARAKNPHVQVITWHTAAEDHSTPACRGRGRGGLEPRIPPGV